MEGFMAKKNAVLTIAMGEKYQKVAKLTHPTIKAYAKKIGAEFIALTDDDKKLITPHWAKFAIYDLLNEYNRIIYLDTDIIVRNDCPSLFDQVPDECFGAFNEGEFSSRTAWLHEAVVKYNEDVNGWNGRFYNTGVMVVSKCHQDIFKLPEQQVDMGSYEQPYINLRVINDNIPTHHLLYRFNRMNMMDYLTGEDPLSSFIVHYAGARDRDYTKLLPLIKTHLERWEKGSPSHKYSRNVTVLAQGGLGDQVALEPLVRFIKNNAYPADKNNIKIVTDWPELFQDGDYGNTEIIHKKDYDPRKYSPAYHILTLPNVEHPLWKFAAHTYMHTIDFGAISALRKTLPDENRNIHLPVTEKGIGEINKFVGDKLYKSIIIHPGKSWASKTFPKEWWEAIVNNLAKDNTVIVFGKQVLPERGYVNINCPKEVIDLRDKLSIEGMIALISRAKVLVSNDSAPIHVAGAFNNWIILIPTAKHPDHILPWRKGSKYYRTFALYKRLTCDDVRSNPTEPIGDTIDYVPGGNIYKYLPEPEEVCRVASNIVGKISHAA